MNIVTYIFIIVMSSLLTYVAYAFWQERKRLQQRAEIDKHLGSVKTTSSYNEVPHTKIPKVDKQNELLTALIAIGHKKEDELADKTLKCYYHREMLINDLAEMTEGELSHVLNHIVREVKHKKELKKK